MDDDELPTSMMKCFNEVISFGIEQVLVWFQIVQRFTFSWFTKCTGGIALRDKQDTCLDRPGTPS